eukprot:TRINITY_DN23704_c0_g1_i3.p1 TRINITY_DN23704_c0_g1~~TRINITY_DN23704_c0_g1_i3.p1  ORF type:complete len:273 (+),score=73.26 TRINITY_DN23704_c0_g1_i3:18-836(+)
MRCRCLFVLLLLPAAVAAVSEDAVVRGVRRLLLEPLQSSICPKSKMIGRQYPKRVCLSQLRPPGDCTVMAIGSRKLRHMKFDFDMARKRGCRVASFDPFVTFTDKPVTELHQRLTFYKTGLSENRTSNMETLDGLADLAGFSTTPIDVLKIDCEGCEWGAFHQILESGSQVLSRVSQLCLELHFEDQAPATFTPERFMSFMKLLGKHSFCPYYREGHPCPMKWPACSPPNKLFERRFKNESFIHHRTEPLIRSWYELAWVKVNGSCPTHHWL